MEFASDLHEKIKREQRSFFARSTSRPRRKAG
jgi:hypothetical protein